MFKITKNDKLVFKYFKKPKIKWYLGKIYFGTPYFYPMNFLNTMIHIRKLKVRSDEEYEEYSKNHPYYSENSKKFSNLPMVRRTKDWIFKLFGNYYFVQIGWPISIGSTPLGWKDKFDTPRFEWSPAFYIFFFRWQLYVSARAPEVEGKNDNYWEQILWFAYYCNYDIKKAKETWGWVDMKTEKSTWNDNYLIWKK